MEKKPYISPEIEVEKLEPEALLKCLSGFGFLNISCSPDIDPDEK